MDDREKYIQDQIAAGSQKGREQLGREYDGLVKAGKIPSPSTTVPTTGAQATTAAEQVLAGLQKLIAAGGGSTVTNKVSPSSRQAIGVSGTQYFDPATGEPLGYFGYTAVGQQPYYSAGKGGARQVEVQPKFFEGDEDQIRRKSPEEIGDLQQQMVASGLLKGKYNPGLADDKTVAAYKDLLGWANSFGTTDPRMTMTRLREGGFSGTSAGVTKYVTNATDLKNVFDKSAQTVLGRSLDEQSLNRLVKAYQQQEVAPTQNTAVAGTKVKEPTAAAFSQQQIQTQNKDEADAYKFAQYAQVLDRLLGG
jgi:hypothetical protein